MKKSNISVFGLIFLLMTGLFADDSPLLYDDSEVSLLEITVDPADLVWMYENVWSNSLHNATIHFSNPNIDETVTDVGLRLRGNTSRVSWKKSFKLSFNDFVPGREFYDVDKMNLNGEHNDPSIIRSKLCWDIYQNIGMIASRSAYSAVYINDAYYGLYISIEQIDDEFLNKNFDDDTGNLWKCNYPAGLYYLGDDPELYKLMENGKRVYELKRNEEADDYSQLARLIDVINNTSSEFLPDSLEAMLDIPGVLKYLAINVLTGSWDDYWYNTNNFYIYHEPSEDRFYIIPYDYDNTFGVDWMNIDWAERDIYQFKNPDTDRPLADRILENDQFRNLYTHFLEFYSSEVYDLALWETRIDSLKEMITPFAEIDSFRTYDYGFTMEDFHNSYSATGYENQHVKNGLKEFINLRNASLAEQIEYSNAAPIIYTAHWLPQNPLPSDTVHVSISAFSNSGLAEVYLEFFPEDDYDPLLYPMTAQPVPGTGCVEDADRWTGDIPPLETLEYGYFRIHAIDNDGLSQFYPRHRRILIQANSGAAEDLVINEFMALNVSTISDEAGEYDDWLELYNPSAESIELSNLFLTDNPDNLDKWQFPPDIFLPPAEYLLIWCDEDQEQGELHTNFKLSGGGEYLAITASDGFSIIDEISFSEQSDDISFGRSPDAAEFWSFMQPTPGAANINVAIEPETVTPLLSFCNYPNPFNPEIRISFSLIENAYILLSVYNPRGQKIITLVDKDFAAGYHDVLWDGRDAGGSKVSSGIYLFKLKINDNSEIINKGLLLK